MCKQQDARNRLTFFSLMCNRSLPVAPAPTIPQDDSAHRPQKNCVGELASIDASLLLLTQRKSMAAAMQI